MRHIGKNGEHRLRRLITGRSCAAALFASLALVPAGVAAAATGGVRSVPAQHSARVAPDAADASAPCYVSGYSLHADQRMAQYNITSDQVEDLVLDYCAGAPRQSNGNYKFTNGKITVITNVNGYVVTVWRN